MLMLNFSCGNASCGHVYIELSYSDISCTLFAYSSDPDLDDGGGGSNIGLKILESTDL
jgi:hypothetical protein